MARIDVSKIDGYASMSAEEKLKALEAYDMPDPDYSGYVKKDVFDKTASELAEKKKELRDRMSEDEAARLKEQEDKASMQEELTSLRRKFAVSEHKSKLVALGYEEALAEDTAEAIADGKLDKVFANQKKHQDALIKKIHAETLKDTPKPTPDGGGSGMDYAKKISDAQASGDLTAVAYYTRLQAQMAAGQTAT